jgi:hypothetical protein
MGRPAKEVSIKINLKLIKNRKMKFKNNKIVHAALSVILVSILTIFQSCSSDMDAAQGLEKGTNVAVIEGNVELNPQDRAEIINSTEFEKYVKASAELASEFKKLESASQDSNLLKGAKKGVTPSGDFITFPFKIDENLFKQVEVTTASLLKKYPSFQNLTRDNMKVLMNEALLNKSIYKIFSEKGLFKKKANKVRRKICIAEGANYMVYDNTDEAYLYASNYAMFNQQEACGYTMANGNVVVYLNPNATDTYSTYPGYTRETINGQYDGVNLYYGSEITGAFQTHLYHSTPSTSTDPNKATDDTAHSGDFGNTPLTILYNGNTYTYNYQNGVNTGLVTPAVPPGSN